MSVDNEDALPTESDVRAVMKQAGFAECANNWSGGLEEMSHIVRAARSQKTCKESESTTNSMFRNSGMILHGDSVVPFSTVCEECGTTYGDHHGWRCPASGSWNKKEDL